MPFLLDLKDRCVKQVQWSVLGAMLRTGVGPERGND